MRTSKNELHDILGKITSVSALVVGDLILDRYIWGKVDRISPEAPVPVVEVRRTEDRLGGAGNVVHNVRSIGAQASVCGLIGDDDEGQKTISLLQAIGAHHTGVMNDRSRPTSLKTRVIAHAQQIVRIDRESKDAVSIALREGFAATVESQIAGANVIILSDYGKGAISDVLMRRLAAAQNDGRLGLEVRPLVLDPHPRNYSLYQRINVVKPNRKEAEAATGLSIDDQESAARAAQAILQKWGSDVAMITLGEDGLVLVSNKEPQKPIMLNTTAAEVFDVSGAGDTVTAIFSCALAAGASLGAAGDLANIGAGIVVREVGTVSVTLEQMREEIERIAAS